MGMSDGVIKLGMLLKKQTDEIERLRGALTDLFSLIDENWLVRNISDDGNPLWALEQLPRVLKLANAKKALNND